MKNKLLLSGLLFFIMTCFGSVKAQTIDSNAVDGQLYVKILNSSNVALNNFNGDVSSLRSDMQQFVGKYGLARITRPFNQSNDLYTQKTYLFEFSNIDSVIFFINDLQELSYIEYVEKVAIIKLFFTPNDPFFNNGNLSGTNWHLKQINAETAWNITQGNNNIVIAVVDNEIQMTHPDLVTQLWVNALDPINGIDDDGNGIIDDFNGADLADMDGNTNPNNILNHGTHCAGIAVGATNNGVGVSSMGFNCRLMPLKATSNNSNFPASIDMTAAINCIDYARTHNANVISLSWGAFGNNATLTTAVTLALNDNITVVAAAGNNGANWNFTPININGVIGVAATDINDIRAQFSNFGPNIDVCAPGVNIFSTNSEQQITAINGYDYKSGTSMATPLVAGLCGLMLSVNPNLTPAQIEACLENTATNIDAINPANVGMLGAGRVNAPQAILCASNNQNAFFIANILNACPNQTISLQGISNQVGITAWNWTFTPAPTTIIGNGTQNVQVTFANGGNINVALTIVTPNGNFNYNQNNYLSISNPTVNLTSVAAGQVCDGSPQEVLLNFQNSFPPINYTITNGFTTQTLISQTISSSFFAIGDINFPQYQVTNITDSRQCVNNTISQINLDIIDCCANLIPNGDFEQGATIFGSDNSIVCNTPAGSAVHGLSSVLDVNPAVLPNLTCSTYGNGSPLQQGFARNYVYTIDARCGANEVTNGDVVPNPLGFNTPAANNGFTSRLWFQQNVPVEAGSLYNFDYYTTGATGSSAGLPFIVRMEIVDAANNELFSTQNYVAASDQRWHQYSFVWDNSPTGVSNHTGNVTVRFLQVQNFAATFFDIAMDDISLRRTNVPVGGGGAYAGADITTCGDPVNLSGSGNPNYTWAPNNGTLNNINIAQPIATPTVTTIYTLTVNNGCGISTDQVIVTVVNVPATPIITANPTQVCNGGTSSLSVPNLNGAIVNWYNVPVGGTPLFVGNPFITPPLTANTTFYAEYQIGNCIGARGVRTINVIASPTVTIVQSNANYCIGQNSVTLTASGATTYTWTPSLGLSSTNGNIVQATPNITTTYSVTGTTNGCNSQPVSATVNVFTPLSITAIANPNTLCSGSSTSLSVSPTNITNIVWNPSGLTGTPVSPTVAVSTTYTVSAKDNNGCPVSTTVDVTVISCGQYCSDPITQAIPNGATSATNPITATTVDILGTYTISSSITYSNIRFRMAPNSQIVVPAGVTLSLLGCKLFSCTDMWNGILIQGNTAELVSNNTWFEDAISAVNSIGGGKYNISKSRFNKNYTGIYIDTYTPANTSIVQSSIFECQTSLTSVGATLKAPYLNTVSHYGIDVLNNAGGLTFGFAGGTGVQNEFRFIDVGIHSSKSKITVHNNYFHDLRKNCVQVPMDDPCQAEGWGIWAETFGELYVGNMATTNLFNNSYSNTFRNCDGGIMAQVHVRKIEIYKNKFEGIGASTIAEPNGKAIFINTNASAEVQYCIIQNNKFKDNYISVQYQANKFLLGRINSNKFNNSGKYGIYCRQNYNGMSDQILDIKFNSMNDSTSLNSIYGIAVQNAVTTNSARLTIESNSIKKIQRAIWVTNMQNKALVVKHNVNYSAVSANAGIIFSSGVATATNPNFGITVENCKGIHVKENDVTKIGSNPNSTFSNTSYGITSSISTAAVISNNTIHKLGRGLISLGTPNASVVTCNYLDKNFYGLVLDNTNIVNQGSTTLAQDNQWSTAAFSTAKTVYSTNSSMPIFYARSAAAQFKPASVTMVPFSPFPAVDFQLTLPNPTYNCTFGCASPPCINPNLARIVKREPPFNLLPAEEQLIADFSTLQMIKENDSLIQLGQPEANTLIAFKDSLLNTNTGLLQTFVEKMDSGDSLLAKQALLAVVPTFSPEQNAKIVDEIYYRTWAKDLFEFTREDSTRLLQVAQQWSVKGGTAVFDARVMIGYWQNDHFINDISSRLVSDSSEEVEGTTDNYGVLYPNPAQNIINYDITLEEGESGLLIIYDVTGKLINTQKIIEGESKSVIDCEKWNNGIYFYRLLINGEAKAAKSFMISK